MNGLEIQAVGRHERRRVEEHIPPERVGAIDQAEVVLHAREIRLRGVAEQVRARRTCRGEQRFEARSVQPQVGHRERRVLHGSALRFGKTTQTVYRVVVVRRQEQPAARPERVALADVLQGPGRIRREDRDVVARSIEMGEDCSSRLFHEAGRRHRAQAARVWIPEDVGRQQLSVLADL